MKVVANGKHTARSVLLTGATGGIGMELAKRYARPGRTLILWGRNPQRLTEIATTCCARGAVVFTRQIDLCDGEAALAAFEVDYANHKPDLVILGAGLSDIQPLESMTEDPNKVLQLAQVNYATPVALATAAAQNMIPNGGGHIALIGSVAGFYELPCSPAYSSSKCGLDFFARAASLAWEDKGVGLTLIVPGFIDTPMSRRLEGPRPFLVSAQSAARRIIRAIGQRKKVYIFPWPFKALRVLERLLPQCVRERILRSLVVSQKERQ